MVLKEHLLFPSWYMVLDVWFSMKKYIKCRLSFDAFLPDVLQLQPDSFDETTGYSCQPIFIIFLTKFKSQDLWPCLREFSFCCNLEFQFIFLRLDSKRHFWGMMIFYKSPKFSCYSFCTYIMFSPSSSISSADFDFFWKASPRL
jgi:hypothetical protein